MIARQILAAALVCAFAVPAHAMTWVDENGYIQIETADGGLLLTEEDMWEPIHCAIQDWPVKGPISHYICEDGFKVTLEVIDLETVLMNGLVMKITEPWPDD